jgi:AraC-like DNA-binding protein
MSVLTTTDSNSFIHKKEMNYTDDRGSSAQIIFQDVYLEGAYIFAASSTQQKQVRMRETQQVPSLNLYFSLEGSSAAHTIGQKADFELGGAQHAMGYTPYFDGYYLINSAKFRNFGIVLYEPFYQRLMANELESLKRFWDKVHQGQAVDTCSFPMDITTAQADVIRDIQQCTFTGQLRQLYYESRIIELYLLQAEQADRLMDVKSLAIKPHDLEKLHAAREYVRCNMLNPFTLGQVARYSGLNDFKLKRGFRQIFGTTVFGYLNELRLNYAKQLLVDSSYTIAETAHTIGYSEPHSFTKAFKKQFGFLPSELKK